MTSDGTSKTARAAAMIAAGEDPSHVARVLHPNDAVVSGYRGHALEVLDELSGMLFGITLYQGDIYGASEEDLRQVALCAELYVAARRKYIEAKKACHQECDAEKKQVAALGIVQATGELMAHQEISGNERIFRLVQDIKQQARGLFQEVA